MPVKTGRKLPRARVDAKVAQAAVRLARHVPAAPSTAGSAKVEASPSAVRLAPRTPPARPSTEAQAHTPTSPLNAEVADLLERLAADATPQDICAKRAKRAALGLNNGPPPARP